MSPLVAVVLPAALVLGGCAAFTDDAVGTANGVQVAAAFYPLEYAAERVGGSRVEVADLTAPGGEPHDVELDVRETAEFARADLVVFERGFQPAVDDAVDENAEGDVVDVTEVLDLVPFRDHGVDSDEDDPHFWQDPLLLADVGDAIAGRLAAVDPPHADDYRANAENLRDDLVRLDRAYTEGLRSCARNTVVVSHDAFGYLQRYGLRTEAILGLSPDSEPTPADLSRLQDLIRSEGVTTVFSESLASPRTADALARDLGVRSEVLDPVEGLSDRTVGEDYLSLMRSNLAALKEANGC
jgi:zinc transport system substrate-binding protein